MIRTIRRSRWGLRFRPSCDFRHPDDGGCGEAMRRWLRQ